MAFYAVMIPPPGSGGAREEVERARLLPETFSWGAFALTLIWMLGKRLWLWSLVFVLVWAGLVWFAGRAGLGGILPAIWFAGALFLGFEGHNLVVRKLARQGWRLADMVEARDLAEAERRYFERALADAPRSVPPSPVIRTPLGAPVPVIGLFPEASGR